MTDTVTPPIVVSPNAGLIDSVQSVGRLVLVIIGTIPLLLKLLGAHDLLAIVAYFRSSDGATFLAAIAGVGSFAYGVYKSHKRGAQIATAATSNRVPDAIVTTPDRAAAARR